MNINLTTDDRTTVGSYDNRSSGGVLLMPKERHMCEGAPIQPHAHALQCAKPAGRFAHCHPPPTQDSTYRRPAGFVAPFTLACPFVTLAMCDDPSWWRVL